MKSKIIKEDIGEILGEFDKNLINLGRKEILITGGNGFIPSYLVDTISEYNKYLINPCKIYIINKNIVGTNSRLSHLIDDPNISFFSNDVGKKFGIPGNPDMIIHAASRANPISLTNDPFDTIFANVEGMKNLLEYSKEKDLESFLFFSSSEIYGNPPEKDIPTPETYFGNVNPLGDMACYSESKRFCETLGEFYFKKYGVPFQSLRIFHTFGPGIRNDGKTISNLFSQGINDGKISLKTPGKSRRSYSYVSDTARGIFRVLFYGAKGEAYNVGNDLNYISIEGIAKKIGDLLGGIPVIIPYENLSKEEFISDRSPNISKLRKLGFEPKISLEEGLNRLKQHYLEEGFQ